MYCRRDVIMTSGGLMMSPWVREEYRTCEPKPTAKEIQKKKNREYTLAQQRERSKHFSRQKFK